MTLTQIFAKVLNMSLTASLVIVLVMAARFVLRKSPKVFSYALWAVVLFRLLCPVSLPSPVSLLGLLDAPVAESDGITSSVEYILTNADGYREIIVQNPVRTEIPDVPMLQQNQQVDVLSQVKSVSVAEIITYVWVAGMAVLFLVGIVSYLRFRRHLTGACQLKGNIYLVDHIDSAFVAGLVFPKIYLPSDLPVKQMRYIIAHEQYHLKRFDHIAKHLAFVALCIHWFNPLVWAAFILSGKDMEMSCDEAVIKKLGEGIRADYSVSLLTLAMGHRIIAGSPLAFGEGDTKGRIKNMASWKKPRKWVSVLSCIVCLAVLTACAANPEKGAVTSKNGGSFEANVVQSATKPAEGQDAPPPAEGLSDSFTSTDTTVLFHTSAELPLGKEMPIVEVMPHQLSTEDARRVAGILFPGIEGYEKDPMLAPTLCKEELQQAIMRWTPYADEDALRTLYGDSSEDLVEIIKTKIKSTTEMMEHAPDDNADIPCQWKFQNEAYYTYSEDEAQASSLYSNEAIMAVFEMNGIPYAYDVVSHNTDGYSLGIISAYIYPGSSPLSMDEAIFRAALCRTEEPTEKQIMDTVSKAKSIISQLLLGQWEIDETVVQCNKIGTASEYIIKITAQPVIEGNRVIRKASVSQLYQYADDYYPSDLIFNFSANGDLIEFKLISPLEVCGILNENSRGMPISDLYDRGKSILSLSDYYAYGPGKMFDAAHIQVKCEININRLEYGMHRVKKREDDHYLYLPGLTFWGEIQYVDQDTGETVYASETPYRLTSINGIDGSVID